MKIENEETFIPFKICIETEEELKELIGVLDKVFGSTMINKLHQKLSNRTHLPMNGLYDGRLDRNSQ